MPDASAGDQPLDHVDFKAVRAALTEVVRAVDDGTLEASSVERAHLVGSLRTLDAVEAVRGR